MFSIALIICALMRGHVVAVREFSGKAPEFRYTVCRLLDGTICKITQNCEVIYYANLSEFLQDLRRSSIRDRDAAIMPDPVSEGLFLTGQEAPAVLIDPPARIKLAA